MTLAIARKLFESADSQHEVVKTFLFMLALGLIVTAGLLFALCCEG